jgi:hypothetical protein
MVLNLRQRSLGNRQELRKLLVLIAAESFGNVRAGGTCCPPDLIYELEVASAWARRCDSNHLTPQRIGRLPGLELLEVPRTHAEAREHAPCQTEAPSTAPST